MPRLKVPFRCLAYVAFLAAFSVLAFGTIEGVLRLSGYGTTTKPFLSRTFDNAQYWQVNPAFYEQFFSVPPYLMVDWDEFEFVMPEKKLPNEVRIFVLGGSAAHGDPDPIRGFPRQLEYMLRAAFPRIEPQVFTLAFPAANSHVMRALAAACARMHPDFFIVYMGNNEFAGPFNDPSTGLTGILSSTTLIRSRIAVSDLRIIQWLDQTIHRPLVAAGLLQSRCHPFAPETPPLDPAATGYFYRNFASNLDDICRLGAEAGAYTILCTVPSNVRHWRPLGVVNMPSLSKEELAQWQAWMDEAAAAEEDLDWPAAITAYTKALTIDEGHAGLQYRLATCLWRTGHFGEASRHFFLARDCDTYHWRADSQINGIIREIANRHSNSVSLADIENAVAGASPHGVPGGEFFHDYVHLNFDGSYQVARAVFSSVAPGIRVPDVEQPVSPPLPRSVEECRVAFAVNPVEEQATLLEEDVYNYVEDGSEYDFDATAVPPRQQLDLLRGRMHSEPGLTACYGAALGVFPSDRRLRQVFTRILLDAGSVIEALEHARHLCDEFPHHRIGHELLAEALLESGQEEEAVDVIGAATRLNPDEPLLDYSAAGIYARAGMPAEALNRYAVATAGEPFYPSPVHSIILQLSRTKGDFRGAREHMASVLLQFPLLEAVNHRLAPVFHDLDELHRKCATPEERMSFWDAFNSRRPGVLLSHVYAARTREETGAHADAQRSYQEAATSGGGILEDICAVRRRSATYLALISDASMKNDLVAVAYLACRQGLQPSPTLGEANDEANAAAAKLNGYKYMLSHPPFDDVTLTRLADALRALQRTDESAALLRCIAETAIHEANTQ